MNSKSPSRWARVKAPVAALAVAGMFGVAVVAPFAMPSAQTDAEALAFEERIHQEFVPNASPEADLVFTDVPVDLSEAEQEKAAAEQAAAEKAAAEKEAAEQAAASSGSGGGSVQAPAKYTGGGSMAEWMTAAGIAEADWSYVVYIAERESGLNPNATNASSGACGLIQALPCSKVPGNGYDPVDNLRWANGYAVDRYGSWAQAYAFWTTNHWW
ncbi:transglycosylase SLT domain-containing protein [Leucobacter allii]|uniref:aggregation-promoting factor C-terminal-like domain-containing protein n=1 Tax=Leucobacter allii TaxID=2932247 RepID=UPI001FCFEB6C|nr:transglycosylase SLT domain-containing protein [Leucobacter allii]UOR00287.1 transglycosylase SLT domain-containing protein [Leucobacter allii]